MNRKQRRILAFVLIVVGVTLMLTVPDSNLGLIVLACAIVIEIVGLVLQKRARR